MHLPSLRALSANSLPWLYSLVVLAVTGIAITGYEFGRPALLFPSLALVALACLPLLPRLRLNMASVTLGAFALFMAVLLLNTVLYHPELLDLLFARSTFMLALPFVLLLAGILSAGLQHNTKPLLWALAVLEAVLVAQLFFSFYTGWGEVHDMRNGLRRAFGVAGDACAYMLCFLALLNFMRNKGARFIFCMIALFITGGKLALIMTAAGLCAAFMFLPKDIENLKRYATHIGIGFVLGAYLTTPGMRQDLLNVTFPHLNISYLHMQEMYPESMMREKVGLLDYLVASGLGRIITIGAAAEMFTQHPLTGVGYNQANNPALFAPAVRADYFNLRERYHVHPLRLEVEKVVGNQVAATTAELGIVGLLALALFYISIALFTIRTWLRLCKHAVLDDTAKLAAIASIWALMMVTLNQTAVWLMSGSALTTWAAFCLCLCTMAEKERA